jgi:hypothetical protein
VTTVRNGVIVPRDRAEFFQVVDLVHGETYAEQVRFASLPVDEKLHVEQHRQREDND